MAIERTLSIIKPDAVAKNVIGKIYSRFETNGLKIVAAQMRQLSQAEAEGFYAVHKERLSGARGLFEAHGNRATPGTVHVRVLPPIRTADMSRAEQKQLPDAVRQTILAEL